MSTPRRWAANEANSPDDPIISDSPISSVRSPFYSNFSDFDVTSPLNYGTPQSARTPQAGSRLDSTPIRVRHELTNDGRSRQFQIDRESSNIVEGASIEAPRTVVWGTNVIIDECRDRFKIFMKSFINDDIEEDEKITRLDFNPYEPFYMQKLDEIHLSHDYYLNLNCTHIKSYDKTLYEQLIYYPQEIIPAFDSAVNQLYFERFPYDEIEQQIQIRPYAVGKVRSMRSLDPIDIGTLLNVSGLVIRATSIIPQMAEAFFKCINCSFSTKVEVDHGRITEPTLCSNCKTNSSFILIHNNSKFNDKQMVRLQETPEDVPIGGQTCHNIVLYAHDDLVNFVSPGERVTVTGIFMSTLIQINPRTRLVSSIHKTHIDVLHFRKLDTKSLCDLEFGLRHQFSEERIAFFKEIASKPNVYDILSASIAPSIFGNEDVKKGVLLQLLSGTRKNFSRFKKAATRSEINILLCGDPGTGKSQMLQYVYKLVPRSQYSSGKGTSAVGLTASVARDQETGEVFLQTGALVLADNGICCIDEFDKMNEMTRSVLHEVMEQQTMSISKSGIICQLNARASILAAANPIRSHWDVNKTIVDNVQLPPSLLSRFDLIFLILDPRTEEYHSKLATHIVNLFVDSEARPKDCLKSDDLREYITYARQNIHPKLTDEASEKLLHTYVNMRKAGSSVGQITAYPRQLESLIRLSEAHAKMRLSETVEIEDVEEATRLHREALKQSAMDPSTGIIDVSLLATGIRSHVENPVT